MSKFPHDPSLNMAYVQLLHSESEVALPRALAEFPDNAELHALAAQQFKGAGNSAGALAETKRALAANPRLPHGYLQLAQLELDVNQPDSAFDALTEATKHGEDPVTVGQFALARGNVLFKAATATQKRDDFQRAMRFLTLAAHTTPAPEAKFLLGASALSVSQSAATDAPASKSCDLSKLADSTLTEAEINSGWRRLSRAGCGEAVSRLRGQASALRQRSGQDVLQPALRFRTPFTLAGRDVSHND